jgi:hypothetical protein
MNKRFLALLAAAHIVLASGCVTVNMPPGTPGTPSRAAEAGMPGPQTTQPAAPSGLPAVEQERVTRLLTTLRDLVNTAPDLARVRWAARQGAVDPALDKKLMDLALQLAPLHKAPPEGTRTLMQAQINALNYAKQGLFDMWQSTPTTLPVRPGAEARAEGLIGDLVKQYADVQTALSLPGARGFIDTKAFELLPDRSSLSGPIRRMVIAPLLEAAAR